MNQRLKSAVDQLVRLPRKRQDELVDVLIAAAEGDLRPRWLSDTEGAGLDGCVIVLSPTAG